MTILNEGTTTACGLISPPRVKMRMLTQMAEALDDQAAGLYRRAAAFEEEEFLLTREIEERQTEVNRLLLKLETMRAERDRVMERIESIAHEATAMREEVVNDEEEVAIAGIESSTSENDSGKPAFSSDSDRATSFFRRMTLSPEIPHS